MNQTEEMKWRGNERDSLFINWGSECLIKNVYTRNRRREVAIMIQKISTNPRIVTRVRPSSFILLSSLNVV